MGHGHKYTNASAGNSFFKPFAEPIAFYSFNHLRPSSAMRNSGESRFFSHLFSFAKEVEQVSVQKYQ
jgi:hypothetical protein